MILHIMSNGNSTHNGSIINLINNRELGFNPEEHVFVMTKESSYKDFSRYENVELNESILASDMKEFNRYASRFDYIILHRNSFTCAQIYRIKRKYLKKIIWCVWGESYLYPPTLKVKKLTRKIRRLARWCIIRIAGRRIRRFYAIGISFKYDAIAVRKMFGDIKILPISFAYEKDKKAKFEKLIKSLPEKDNNAPCKIMIGHSAFWHLNHMEILDKLYRFKDENILISLVLSYGDGDYAKEVEDYALAKFPGKVEAIFDYMSHDDYIRYLNTVDIWILDYAGQNALGNFVRLLYLGKKIFLNEDSVMMLASRIEALEVYKVPDIDNMTFEEFSRPIENKDINRVFAEASFDENRAIRRWKSFFKELK